MQTDSSYFTRCVVFPGDDIRIIPGRTIYNRANNPLTATGGPHLPAPPSISMPLDLYAVQGRTIYNLAPAPPTTPNPLTTGQEPQPVDGNGDLAPLLSILASNTSLLPPEERTAGRSALGSWLRGTTQIECNLLDFVIVARQQLQEGRDDKTAEEFFSVYIKSPHEMDDEDKENYPIYIKSPHETDDEDKENYPIYIRSPHEMDDEDKENYPIYIKSPQEMEEEEKENIPPIKRTR